MLKKTIRLALYALSAKSKIKTCFFIDFAFPPHTCPSCLVIVEEISIVIVRFSTPFRQKTGRVISARPVKNWDVAIG